MGEVCSSQVGPAKISFAEVCSCKKTTRYGVIVEASITKIYTAEVCLREISLAEVCVAKVSATQFGTNEVRMYIRMLFPPLVPRFHPLFEDAKMFLIGHTISSLQDSIHDQQLTVGQQHQRKRRRHHLRHFREFEK